MLNMDILTIYNLRLDIKKASLLTLHSIALRIDVSKINGSDF